MSRHLREYGVVAATEVGNAHEPGEHLVRVLGLGRGACDSSSSLAAFRRSLSKLAPWPGDSAKPRHRGVSPERWSKYPERGRTVCSTPRTVGRSGGGLLDGLVARQTPARLGRAKAPPDDRHRNERRGRDSFIRAKQGWCRGHHRAQLPVAHGGQSGRTGGLVLLLDRRGPESWPGSHGPVQLHPLLRHGAADGHRGRNALHGQEVCGRVHGARRLLGRPDAPRSRALAADEAGDGRAHLGHGRRVHRLPSRTTMGGRAGRAFDRTGALPEHPCGRALGHREPAPERGVVDGLDDRQCRRRDGLAPPELGDGGVDRILAGVAGDRLPVALRPVSAPLLPASGARRTRPSSASPARQDGSVREAAAGPDAPVRAALRPHGGPLPPEPGAQPRNRLLLHQHDGGLLPADGPAEPGRIRQRGGLGATGPIAPGGRSNHSRRHLVRRDRGHASPARDGRRERALVARPLRRTYPRSPC
jgi:hypothetical protein